MLVVYTPFSPAIRPFASYHSVLAARVLLPVLYTSFVTICTTLLKFIPVSFITAANP